MANKMKCIIFLLLVILNVSLLCQEKVYTNGDLDFQFTYDNNGYSPFRTETTDSCAIEDFCHWQKYESVNLGISFGYPSELIIRDDWIDGRIEAGYKNYFDDSVFYPVITITKTKEGFIRIVNSKYNPTIGRYGFVKDTTINGVSWRIVGDQGTENAVYFEGTNCEGLRGESTRRIYTCDEYSYSGYINFYVTVLLIRKDDGRNIVLSFYNGLLDECVNEKGTPESEICEDTFFKIASTIGLINK